MSDAFDTPSRFLPSLRPAPDFQVIQIALQHLKACLSSLDDFEQSHARNWLIRLIAQNDEDVIDEASNLLARLSGRSAAPEEVTVYRFTGENGQNIQVSIRDNTLVEIGSVTWEAASIMTRRILRSPLHASKILELGSGTGLVGLAIAARLSTLAEKTSIALSDYHPIVLSNLQHNVDQNALKSSNTSVQVKAIDWRELEGHPQQEYDLLIGSDLIYGQCASTQCMPS